MVTLIFSAYYGYSMAISFDATARKVCCVENEDFITIHNHEKILESNFKKTNEVCFLKFTVNDTSIINDIVNTQVYEIFNYESGLYFKPSKNIKIIIKKSDKKTNYFYINLGGNNEQGVIIVSPNSIGESIKIYAKYEKTTLFQTLTTPIIKSFNLYRENLLNEKN